MLIAYLPVLSTSVAYKLREPCLLDSCVLFIQKIIDCETVTSLFLMLLLKNYRKSKKKKIICNFILRETTIFILMSFYPVLFCYAHSLHNCIHSLIQLCILFHFNFYLKHIFTLHASSQRLTQRFSTLSRRLTGRLIFTDSLLREAHWFVGLESNCILVTFLLVP